MAFLFNRKLRLTGNFLFPVKQKMLREDAITTQAKNIFLASEI